MPDRESRAERYRRLAQECLKAAQAMSTPRKGELLLGDGAKLAAPSETTRGRGAPSAHERQQETMKTRAILIDMARIWSIPTRGESE
jgi:hypothetical protein